MAPPIRTDAFCAVGPDNRIDIDRIRRSIASAQYAAVNSDNVGRQWPALAMAGWAVVPVRIYAGEMVPEELVAPELLPPRASEAPRAAPRPAKTRTAAERKSSPFLLRCSD